MQCLPRNEIRLHQTIWFWNWNHKNTLVFRCIHSIHRLNKPYSTFKYAKASDRQTDMNRLFFPMFCTLYIVHVLYYIFGPGRGPGPNTGSDPYRTQQKPKLIRLNHISHFLVTITNCSIKFLWDFYNILLHAVACWWSHYMISTKCTFYIIPCGLVSLCICIYLPLLLLFIFISFLQ